MTIHLTRTQRYALEALLPSYHSIPRHSWAELQPLIEAGLVERIGFTPVITPAGLVALNSAASGPQVVTIEPVKTVIN